MTLDKEEHREFLLNAIYSAPVQGRFGELKQFVAAAEALETAIKSAVIVPPLAGEDLHA